jgi:hypothetical protein
VVDTANEEYNIQDTALDNSITSKVGGLSGNPQYRISNTLESIKNSIYPYMQRFVYIGLTLATILLLWNGFLMVTNAANGGDGDRSKIKKNFINIGIGVVILTGFYYLLDVVLIVVNFLFQ